MASIVVNKIVEANVYLNGNNQAGKAKEIKFPKLEMDMQEQDALGMAMTISLPGKLKELEGENTRLKRLLANAMLENEVIKEALQKKW